MKFSKTTYLYCFTALQEARVYAERNGVLFNSTHDNSDVWTTLCRMLVTRRKHTLQGI